MDSLPLSEYHMELEIRGMMDGDTGRPTGELRPVSVSHLRLDPSSSPAAGPIPLVAVSVA